MIGLGAGLSEKEKEAGDKPPRYSTCKLSLHKDKVYSVMTCPAAWV